MSMKSQVLMSLLVCGFAAGIAQGQTTITFRSGSGDGVVGTQDPYVTVLAGPLTSGFTALTPTDFANAQITPAMISTRLSEWSMLSADPDARWINTTGNGSTTSPTGLYAIHFFNPEGYVTEATLDLYYAVDNQLGWLSSSNTVLTAAVYLNGEPLISIDRNVTPTGNAVQTFAFTQQHELSATGLMLNPGDNWLYINASNTGLGAGVIFSGTIYIPTSSVPEPASLGVLALGAAGLLLRRRK